MMNQKMIMMLITQCSLVPAFSEIKRDFLFDPNRDVYSTKGTDHWGTEENRPWEENRPQICEKIANFGVFTLF